MSNAIVLAAEGVLPLSRATWFLSAGGRDCWREEGMLIDPDERGLGQQPGLSKG